MTMCLPFPHPLLITFFINTHSPSHIWVPHLKKLWGTITKIQIIIDTTKPHNINL